MTFKNKKRPASRLLTIWLPVALFPVVDRAAALDHSNRSQFIRKAIREKLQRLGINAS